MACRLSQRVEYAVRALVELALVGDAGLSGTQIAMRGQIPKPFLKQILAILVKGGIVESTRGPRGKYCLGKRPEEISLYRLLAMVEGEIVFFDPATPPGPAIQTLYSDIREDLVGVLDRFTLDAFVEAASKDRNETRPMFFI